MSPPELQDKGFNPESKDFMADATDYVEVGVRVDKAGNVTVIHPEHFAIESMAIYIDILATGIRMLATQGIIDRNGNDKTPES